MGNVVATFGINNKVDEEKKENTFTINKEVVEYLKEHYSEVERKEDENIKEAISVVNINNVVKIIQDKVLQELFKSNQDWETCTIKINKNTIINEIKVTSRYEKKQSHKNDYSIKYIPETDPDQLKMFKEE